MKEEEYEGEALLMTLTSSIEADLIESQLRSFGIPVLRKYKGSSGYINVFMGASNLGVDLYVPNSALETARDLLDATPEAIEDAEPFDYDEFENKRKSNASMLLWIIAIPVIAVLLYELIKRIGRF